jgi:hypothetical protein
MAHLFCSPRSRATAMLTVPFEDDRSCWSAPSADGDASPIET